MSERTIRRLFDISVILKGLHAAVELASGLVVLVVSPAAVMSLASALTADELSEDPRDFFANWLIRQAGRYSVSFQHLAALYLISHGAVVGFLVWGLLSKRLWSYPAAVVILGVFIAYQAYQYVAHPTWWLIAVTALDLVVIFLTAHEYRYVKSEKAAGAHAP